MSPSRNWINEKDVLYCYPKNLDLDIVITFGSAFIVTELFLILQLIVLIVPVLSLPDIITHIYVFFNFVVDIEGISPMPIFVYFWELYPPVWIMSIISQSI